VARRQPAQSRLRLVTVAAGLVLVGMSAAVAAFTADEPSAADGALPLAEFADPGVVHVHGLGVDPQDDAVYAATHMGLFRIPEDGQAVRVANRYQDTMGFEVLGPGRFLGSGHPDFREDDTPLLGLIESRDAGRTWTPLSLRGEADFHAIEARHGQVYAYDSTSETFMVSANGEWDRRSELVVLDFAVSPEDAELVLATTEAGLQRSTDGGRSWTSPPEAPELAVMSWDETDEIVGVAADGAVHASIDGGRTWSPRGDVGGVPEAITPAHIDGAAFIFVAVADRGILESSDGGRTFQVRYSEK
jgi:hypothetical protein